VLNDLIQSNQKIVCTLANNGKLGLTEYQNRLEAIKKFVKVRMKLFFKQVERINLRLKIKKQEIDNQESISPNSGIKFRNSSSDSRGDARQRHSSSEFSIEDDNNSDQKIKNVRSEISN
jgi:hypothetical protein